MQTKLKAFKKLTHFYRKKYLMGSITIPGDDRIEYDLNLQIDFSKD